MNIQLRPQRTVAQEVEVTGFGFWSGRDVRVRILPAPEDHGIVFVREDLARPVRIPAEVSRRVEMPRRTTLAHRGASVEMVEHVLASLSGLRIDNCEIRVDQPELPGGDGSSGMFVDALDRAGAEEQSARRAVLVVDEPLRVEDDNGLLEAVPATDGAYTVHYHLDYGADTVIGKQSFRIDVTAGSFRRELSRARTFLLKSEAEWLRNQGLGQRVTCREVLVFDDRGVVDNELRFANECVRHKTLDLIGDLALARCDLVGSFTAHKSGHRLNAELVKVLLAECRVVREMRRSA